jgi:hypothetical protein
MGVGFGVNPEKSGGLGWIDQALARIGKKRKISIFTRHYQMPALLAANADLIATLADAGGPPAGAEPAVGDQGAAILYSRVRIENGLVPVAASPSRRIAGCGS